jgi:hypothetical protein
MFPVCGWWDIARNGLQYTTDSPRLTQQWHCNVSTERQSGHTQGQQLKLKYSRQSNWNPNMNTPEPYQQQHDRPGACVMAHQYSSATFVSLPFHSSKEKYGARFKNVITSIFLTLFFSGPGELSRYSDSLRAGRSRDRNPVRARFSAPVQTGPEVHPTCYTMGSRSFPGVKRPGRGVEHPPSSSAEVKETVELCIYSPSRPSRPVIGWILPLPLPIF